MADDDTPETHGDELRIDRATLRPARRRDDGSWVYDAVLARVDAELVYSWGREVATEEALSSPEYLEGLRGLAVTAGHPAKGRVEEGDRVDVGTVLDARYDRAERAVLVELVVRDAAANAKIRDGYRDISEGYRVPRMDATQQPARQLQRVPNHVALALEAGGRMPGASLRFDTTTPDTPGGSVDELAKVLALLQAQGLRTDSADSLRDTLAQLRTDAAELPKLRERLATVQSALGVDEDLTAAAVGTRIDAMVKERAAAIAEWRGFASDLGVELRTDAADDVPSIRKALAAHTKLEDDADLRGAVKVLAAQARERRDSDDPTTTYALAGRTDSRSAGAWGRS